MERFYLKNIELLNFRRFDNSTYELNPQMNVFIGRNASGKTAVLEAATVVLGAYLAAFKEYVPSRFGHNISDSDVLKKSMKPVKSIALTSAIKQFPCIVSSQIMWDKDIKKCIRSLEKEGGRTKFVGKLKRVMLRIKYLKSIRMLNRIWKNGWVRTALFVNFLFKDDMEVRTMLMNAFKGTKEEYCFDRLDLPFTYER